MDIRRSLDYRIPITASIEMKFHSSITKQTFMQSLLDVSNGINVERKLAFLYDFHNSLKKILTCVACERIRHDNSSAYYCGHHCKVYSKDSITCSEREMEGRQRDFNIEHDYSDLFAVFERLQTNFNVERIFLELLKFFLTAPHWLKEEDSAMVIHKIIKNSPETSLEYIKSSNKFTTASKSFKTLMNETPNFKKKSIFLPDVSVVQPQISKNYSRRLLLDSNHKSVTSDSTLEIENSDVCPDLQVCTNNSRNSFIAELPDSHCERAKRKLSKNYLTDAPTKKRCPETDQISIKPEVAISSNECLSNPFRSTKKHVSNENSSSSSPYLSSTTCASSENAEGTFIGFIDSDISESYHRFQTAIKCFGFLESMEREDSSKMTTELPSLPFFNCVDVLSRTGCADSFEKDEMKNPSFRLNSLKNNAHECDCKEECDESIKISGGCMEMQLQESQESDPSSRIEIDVVDDKQEVAHIHQEVRKSVNSVLSLPDPELEEAIDINSWQHDEKVCRKKKSLMFKSVKERNRRRIFFDGSVKLPSADDTNVVQFKMPAPQKQSETSNDSQIHHQKQSLPNKIFAKKKGDIKLTRELNTCHRLSNSSQETAVTKLMSSMNDGSCSNWVSETKADSSFVGKSNDSPTRSSRFDVNSLETGNEEDSVEVSKIPVPNIEQNVTLKSCPVPSTIKLPPIFDSNSNSKDEFGLSSESKTCSSISTEAFFKTAEFIPSVGINKNTVSESLPVAIPAKSIASIGFVSVSDCNYDASLAFPSNFLQSPVPTYKTSSCSLELIEQSSPKIVATVSDTVTNGDHNDSKEIVTSIPSQPITMFSSSSKGDISTVDKTDQTAGDVKYAGDVELDVSYSGEFKSDDLVPSSIRTKEKNLVDPSLEKIEFDNHCMDFAENLTESPKKSILDTINSCDFEEPVVFSTKNNGSAEEILTIPTSPRTKSVSCQTTCDLHVSLLMREFPRLFNQQSNGVSVYDTRCMSTPTDLKASNNLKTPRVFGTSRRTSFTAVSSVTSSEKKLVENLFMNRSVLDDSSFYSVALAEKTSETSIQPLPSTGKKVFPVNAFSTDETPYRIGRSTFELDSNVDLEKQKNVMDNSLYAASSTPLCQTNASCCSSVNTISRQGEIDQCILKRTANESNEVEFADLDHKNDEFGSAVNKKISGEQNNGNRSNTENVNVVPDQNVIFNKFCAIKSTQRIFPEVASNRVDRILKNSSHVTSAINHASHNGTTSVRDDSDVDMEEDDDDDEVEFIAGTPTNSRRCVDDNLEKLMTQSFSLKNKFHEENQTVLDNRLKNSSSPSTSQSLIDHSRTQLPSLPVPDLPSSEMSDTDLKPSLDLFSSTAANSVQASPSLAIVMTGLKDADVKLVNLFCQRFSVPLLHRITSETTHLVVKTDCKSRTARTFKYLQAIVYSICVISIEWVQACIDTKKIINEETFIPFDSSGECGPLRAYKSRRGAIPSPLSWLRDYCLFFMKPVPSACTLIQLQEIVEKTGAVVINDLKDFEKYPTLHHLIIVSDEEESSQTSNTDIASWLQIYQAVAIEFNWLLEVVGRNRVVPFADYELVDIPSKLLLKLDFPTEMLQYEREDVEDSD